MIKNQKYSLNLANSLFVSHLRKLALELLLCYSIHEVWNFTVPLDSNTTHKFGNTENTTLTYDGDISETETTTLTYMGDVEDIEDHIKKMENHPDLCKGIIHKPRGQILRYFWPPFVVTFTK